MTATPFLSDILCTLADAVALTLPAAPSSADVGDDDEASLFKSISD